ncbi:heterokaryon incompatibility protein-domain-containing protein [Chaetomium sp. MPI-CAGE-AT-0009]|nr:heterokaryon incompatibility protein-domain-containing protein [Chaetomium sp. MPI-CAGE-AT-0009]
MALFCPQCQNIIDNLFNESRYEPGKGRNGEQIPDILEQRFRLLDNYRDIVSVSENCGLCALIKNTVLGNLNKDEAGNPKLPDLAEEYTMQMKVTGGNKLRPALKDGGLQVYNVAVGTALDIGLGAYATDMMVHFSITASKGSRAATSGNVLGVGPFADSGSAEALSVLEGWVNECVAGHEECRWPKVSGGREEETKPELPTRVIDVGTDADGGTVRLVETKGRRDDYAALSHCWGPPEKRPLCTTKATFSQHLAGIPVSSLPKTFYDAVAITRRLNLRYLWIDSLCIVQDDRNDWSMEAPRMGSLYSRAYLVIAASGARDSSEGCFVPRTGPNASIKIPYKVNGIQDGHILLTMRNRYLPMLAWQPLGTRAWVLQEWVLARRLIHFTSTGLMWSCHRLGKDAMREDGVVVGGSTVQSWDDVIESYTIRDLTYSSDKLAAVEGMSNEMQGSRKDRYFSGLWTGELPQQAFWIGRETRRPDELQGFPTWSWASTRGSCIPWTPKRIHGEVLSIHSKCEVEDESTLVVTGKGRECLIKEWAHLVHDHVQEPPFSAHKTSSISRLPVYFYKTVVHRMLDPATGTIIGIAVLDDTDRFGEGEYRCASLFLMREDDHPSRPGEEIVYLALLVRVSSENPGYYQRIGVGFIVDMEWFRGEEEQKFKIN